MKAVVLGAAGQLGAELVRSLGAETAVPHREVSITDAGAVAGLLRRRRPEVVFNCAAYNAVDRAESEPDVAIAVNAHGPGIVAEACRAHGARLVHYSTNFVFDGTLDRPYIESDSPSPQSAYARSKREGEERVLEAMPEALVLRTAAVFGGAASFPARIVERARNGAPIRVVGDQQVNPTYAAELAAASLELAERGDAGIVHVVGGGCCGWDDFARAALEGAGLDVEVESIPTEAYPAPARRPRNGCLDTVRFRPLRPWRQAVDEWASSLKRA